MHTSIAYRVITAGLLLSGNVLGKGPVDYVAASTSNHLRADSLAIEHVQRAKESRKSASFIAEGGWYKALSIPDASGFGFQASYVIWLSRGTTLGPGIGYLNAGAGNSLTFHGDFRAWLSSEESTPFLGLSAGYLLPEEGAGSIFLQPAFGVKAAFAQLNYVLSVGCILLADENSFESSRNVGTILTVKAGLLF